MVKSIINVLLFTSTTSLAPKKAASIKAQSREVLHDLISKKMVRSSMVDQTSSSTFLGALQDQNDWVRFWK